MSSQNHKMHPRIPSLPVKKVKALYKYADDHQNWVDVDLEEDFSKYKIIHKGVEIHYIIEYKNDEQNIGPLPVRHLAFMPVSKIPEPLFQDFINRTLKAFGFKEYKVIEGKSGRLNYYSPLFKLDE